MNNLYLLPNAEEEVIDSYDEDIIITNRDGKIIKATHLSGRQYGVSAEELLGQSVYELEVREIFSPAITPFVLKQKKKVVLIQTAYDGRKVLITGVPLFNEQHEVEFIMSYSYEVSELLALQEYLNEMDGEMSRVKEELVTLREEQLHIDGLIAESKEMKQVLKSMKKVAPLKVPVVLQGENGVGKSTLAKWMHKQSDRQGAPFIEVDCTAIPEAIFHYELTGNNSTNKVDGKAGYLQLAQSGSLYLQGVDELSLYAQTILYKALRETKANFRIISSSTENLEELVAKKEFREDLFYLLYVVPVSIKPLRERLEDLSTVISQYVERFNATYQLNRTLSDDLFRTLLHMEWKGNHLEVKNLIQRLVTQSESTVMTKDDLPVTYRQAESELELEVDGRKLAHILENVEEKVLLSAKKRYKTTTEMAEMLGISQPSVVRKLKKYSI
ncbi:sigma 54-interacting transcriptional regulator [Virgibacillus ainsalahensis]